MTALPSGKRSLGPIALFVLLFSATAMPLSSGWAAADEIPHENYDLVGSDLEAVVMMLNASIRYSERALMCMYNQTMALAEQNLSVVRNILVPAERVLEEIENLASSYENLSEMIPPFAELSRLMDGFADDEVALLDIRTELVNASALPALTGDELIAALDAIREFNELIVRMNGTIDDMLVSAEDITELAVEGKRPFEQNQLAPLIEKLRALLVMIEEDISRIIEEDLPLGESEPFLILWISSSNYYLGDAIIGGGYLFFDGAFATGYQVRIVMDGSELTYATTSTGGKFSFAYQIPLESSWVGVHTIMSECATPVGDLVSDTLSFRISLIPTTITLALGEDEISFSESVLASVTLKDFRGNPLESGACRFVIDGEEVAFQTDEGGTESHTWQGDELGYGSHSVQALFGGEVPYAASSSAIKDITVNIPTSINLLLFSTEVRRGQFIVGNGTLYANGTERLVGQNIAISIDGVVVANLTTGADGEFAFTIDSEQLAIGGHTLSAALGSRDPIWRYSQDEEGFVVKWYKEGGYPFWPVIPGWGGIPGDLIPYLFIGKNAYFFWLLLLAFTGVMIRLLQMRKRALRREAAMRSEELEPMDSAMRASGAAAAPPTDAFELPPPTEGPSNPNERIVWYYQRFLAFLLRKGWPGLRASMTHREVARVLKAFGYPQDPVEDATMLFERALYSGTRMTNEDAIQMSAAMTNLVRPGSRGVRDAV